MRAGDGAAARICRHVTSLFAFLHHIAAFALVAALAIQFILLRDELSPASARRLLMIDAVLGLSALTVLAIGFARVFFFEKGATYYFHSAPFIGKVSLFVLVALLGIYPTRKFLSWRGELKRGVVPAVTPVELRRVRAIVHLELIGIVLVILCAVWMARGVGHFDGQA